MVPYLGPGITGTLYIIVAYLGPGITDTHCTVYISLVQALESQAHTVQCTLVLYGALVSHAQTVHYGLVLGPGITDKHCTL
jgi:hypothetical protein